MIHSTRLQNELRLPYGCFHWQHENTKHSERKIYDVNLNSAFILVVTLTNIT